MSTGVLEQLDPFEEFNATPEGVERFAAFANFAFLLSGKDSSGLLPPWHSPKRDRALRGYVHQSDQLSSAVNTMMAKIVSIPRRARATNKNNAASVRRIDRQWQNLEVYSQNMRGLDAALRLFLLDYYTQDNGAFMVILAPGDYKEPPTDLPIAVKHLDSSRCIRTGDVNFPVLYKPTRGDYKDRKIPLHRSRVIALSSMESADEEMNGVGFCAISRAINAAQTMIDLYRYKNEKMGSRPNRQILWAKGMTTKELNKHLETAAMTASTSTNKIYAKTLPIGTQNTDADIKLIDMVATPDFFDEKVSVTLAMYALSFAFGVDARTFFPASETGATKADASIQHLKAMGQGIGEILRQLEAAFNLYVLPSGAVLEHDYVDDEQDKNQAEIRQVRAQTRRSDLDSGVMNIRTAREKMLDAGELTPEEFEQLELEDGRLEDGTSTTLLFYSQDTAYTMIAVNPFDDVLDTESNDTEAVLGWIRDVRRIIRPLVVNAIRYDRKQEALRMLTALSDLEELYSADNTEAEMQEQVDISLDEELPPAEGELIERQHIPFDQKTFTQYRRAIRANMLGLYRGDFSRSQFNGAMRSTIGRQLRQAFVSGAKTCGVQPGDFTAAEQEVINGFVREERSYLTGLADVVIAARDAKKPFKSVNYKIDMWAARWNEVFAAGQVAACGDKKLKWVYDDGKQHCRDCARLNGKVYRASTWAEIGITPQSTKLECFGRYCGCKFVETDEPVSRGARPAFKHADKNAAREWLEQKGYLACKEVA